MDWRFLITGRRTLALIGALAVLFAWLFRYELRPDKSGNIVRLNRLTGAVATIIGDKLVVAEKPMKLSATKAHEWKSVTIEDLGNLQLKVTTMWRDDCLLYRVDASPFSEQIRKAFEDPLTRAKLRVLFDDENGFEIATVDVEIKDVARIVDGKGGFSEIERKGSVPLSFGAYSQIHSMNVAWNGFLSRTVINCVAVRNWDVKERSNRSVLILDLTNSCSQTFVLEGTVKLWDLNGQPIGDRRIRIGQIAANQSGDFEHTFDPSVGNLKFVALR
jgi:hypothetical protein